MLELFKNSEQKERFISTYVNPFKSGKVKTIEFKIENSFWTNNKISYKSCVSFLNNDTSGYHRIEADSFPELIQQTEDFIRSL